MKEIEVDVEDETRGVGIERAARDVNLRDGIQQAVRAFAVPTVSGSSQPVAERNEAWIIRVAQRLLGNRNEILGKRQPAKRGRPHAGLYVFVVMNADLFG